MKRVEKRSPIPALVQWLWATGGLRQTTAMHWLPIGCMVVPICFCITATSCCPARMTAAFRQDSVRSTSSVQTIERLVRDTLWMQIPAQAERTLVRDTISVLENEFASSVARVYTNGLLGHELRTKPRRHATEVWRRETQILRVDTVCINRVRRDVVEVARPLTWWQQTQIRGFWILLIAVLLILRRIF